MSFHTDQSTKERVAKEFGIPIEDVDWYHSGICYDRIGVKTQESADKVTAVCNAQNREANGGWFDGMPLGGQSKSKRADGTEIWDVHC